MVPDELAREGVSPAERLLFRELNTQLGSDYLILHSVKWVSFDKGRQHDGEVDFLIAHPDQGVLLLEVKGGTVRREGGDRDLWFSTDLGGQEHAIHNPFRQVERSMYALKMRLETTPATSGFHYALNRTVAFPDVLVADERLGTDVNRDIVIDSSNIYLLAKAIQRAMSGGAPGPGKDGVNALLELTYPSFALKRMGLATRVKDGDSQVLQLTQQQLGLLDSLGSHRRIAVAGIAGSGKTVMAVEHARRLAADGLDVLFTCFNRALAAEVRAELGHLPNATVRAYHELAEEFVRESGLALPVADSELLATYFENDLPELFAEAISVLDKRFDAIVVDEGQDFADVWWVTLEALQRTPEDSILAVFYDNNQGIFRSSYAYPIPLPHFRLSRNCRCTQQIHDLAARFVDLERGCQGSARNGEDVEQILVPETEVMNSLRRTVHRLTHDEGIPVDQIVVLTPRSRAKSLLQDGMKIGNLVVDWEGQGSGKLACRTVHAFKGLESPVVILVEMDRAHRDTRNRLIHVALTRARHHAVVIGELPAVA
jgi:hypothetical protein